MAKFLIEPPTGLLEKILKRIHREERTLVLRKVFIFSATLVGSFIGFIPSVKMLFSDFTQSGFLNFSSLFLSDFSTVMAHWQSFLMVLLETLPVISLAFFLAVLLLFLQSIRSLSKNVKIIFKTA